MAYENVDVSRAKNAINNCLNSLNHPSSDNFLSTLPGNTNWVADSKNTFVSAVDKLVNVRYKELKDYLNQCLTTLDNIEKYQNLQSQNATYNSQLSSKNNELNIHRNNYRNMNDKTTSEAKNLKNKIDRLETEIRDLNRKINSNKDDMSNINRSISA
ncbi:MAG: hypothetical protein IKF36_04460 [Bacilli bacterium]|nr:hypothetical protein [Bacilli bacterium]